MAGRTATVAALAAVAAVAVAASGLPPAAAQEGVGAPGPERPVFAFEFESYDLAPAEFVTPFHAAFGPDGIMAVADYGADTIQVFDANGTFDYGFGSPGGRDRPGAFNGPSDIAFGPNGTMAVADTFNDRIQVFHANGAFAYHFGAVESHCHVACKTDPGEFNSPASVDFGPGGIMAVADRNNHRIQVFHANGTFDYKIGYDEDDGDGDHHGHSHGSGGEGDGPGEFSHPIGVEFGPGGIMAVADRNNHRIQVFHANGTFDYEFGSNGTGPGEFNRTNSVDFGPGGIMAVADRNNHRIQVFHANGTFAYQFGSRGDGPGEFEFPAGVEFGPGGIMAVADSWNNRIQVFHANGTFDYELRSWLAPAKIGTPASLAFGPGGIMAVADVAPHARVQVYHANGTLDYQLGSNGTAPGAFKRPAGVAFGPGGIMAVADAGNNRIQVFHANGTFDYQFGSRGGSPDEGWAPRGVAFGPGGIMAVAGQTQFTGIPGSFAQLFFVASNTVQVFHANGTFDYEFAVMSGSGSSPVGGVAFGPDGTMAVNLDTSHRIEVFHANGTFDYGFGSRGGGPGNFSHPGGVAFGPGGTLAVADTYNHRIQVFHANGTFDYEFGSRGGGPGNFSGPEGVAFGPNGTMAVADAINKRIQVFYPPSWGDRAPFEADMAASRPPPGEYAAPTGGWVPFEADMAAPPPGPVDPAPLPPPTDGNGGDGTAVPPPVDPAPGGNGGTGQPPLPPVLHTCSAGVSHSEVAMTGTAGGYSAVVSYAVANTGSLPFGRVEADLTPWYAGALSDAGPGTARLPASLTEVGTTGASGAFTAVPADGRLEVADGLGGGASASLFFRANIPADAADVGTAFAQGVTYRAVCEPPPGEGPAPAPTSGNVTVAHSLVVVAPPVDPGPPVVVVVPTPPPVVVVPLNGTGPSQVNVTAVGNAANLTIDVAGLADSALDGTESSTVTFPPSETIVAASFATVTFPPNVTASHVPADGRLALRVAADVPADGQVQGALAYEGSGSVALQRVVEVGGVGPGRIVFDMPVRIFLEGQAGGRAFYIDGAGGAITPIDAACAADNATRVHVHLGGSGECQIDSADGGKVVYTYHLTRFGTVLPANAAALPPTTYTCAVGIEKADLGVRMAPGEYSAPVRQTIINQGSLPFERVGLDATPWRAVSGAGGPLPDGDLLATEVAVVEGAYDVLSEGTAVAHGLGGGVESTLWFRVLAGGGLQDGMLAQDVTYRAECAGP